MSLNSVEEIHITNSDKSKPKKYKILNMVTKTIKETFTKSTCHGFPNLIQSKNIFLRILWIITIAVFSGLCNYMIIVEFIAFFNYPFNTHLKRVFQIPAEFPSLSICNKNMFMSVESLEFAKSILKKHNLTLESYFFESNNFDLKSASMINNHSDEFRKNLGLPLNQFILSCRYDDQNCFLENDFAWFYHKKYGNCYKFGSSKEAFFPGKEYGLMLALNLSIFEGLIKFTKSLGAVVILDNGFSEIDIPIGFETNLKINKIYSKHLNKPYDSCQFDEEWPASFNRRIYDLFLKNGLAYNQRDCIEICYQNLALSKCNCSDRNSIRISSNEYCFEDKDNKCLVEAYKIFEFKENSYVFNVCLPACPLECTNKDFQFTSSFSQLTPDYRNTANVNIYYESLSYLEMIESEAITITDLISRIGGILGLFLGISFMSFMEFVDMFFKIFLILISKIKK
jgi:hypothetical protein